MNLRAILQNPDRPDKNGQHSIAFYICIDSKPEYLPSGLKASKKEWDRKECKFKKGVEMAIDLNAQLRRKRVEYETRLMNGETIEQIKNKDRPSGSLLQFIGIYIQEVRNGLHEIRDSTRLHYESSYRVLDHYRKWKGLDDLRFNDINLDFYQDFHSYIINVRKGGNPGFGNHIKRVKKFMGVARERGLHDNKEYTKRGFKTLRSEPDKVYLNEEEIKALEELNLSAWPDLEKERDRWLFSFYTLTRYEDSLRISKKNLVTKDGNHFLIYQAQKTDRKVMIPLKPSAMAIMEKYKWDFGRMYNSKSNHRIKRACSMAGINTIVVEDNIQAPKCELVTTHTARRSAAISLNLAGVSLNDIMDLGGWSSMEMLRVYLKHGSADSAKKAINHEFFK